MCKRHLRDPDDPRHTLCGIPVEHCALASAVQVDVTINERTTVTMCDEDGKPRGRCLGCAGRYLRGACRDASSLVQRGLAYSAGGKLLAFPIESATLRESVSVPKTSLPCDGNKIRNRERLGLRRSALYDRLRRAG